MNDTLKLKTALSISEGTFKKVVEAQLMKWREKKERERNRACHGGPGKTCH